jgi:hypothetical protein
MIGTDVVGMPFADAPQLRRNAVPHNGIGSVEHDRTH